MIWLSCVKSDRQIDSKIEVEIDSQKDRYSQIDLHYNFTNPSICRHQDWLGLFLFVIKV